MRYVQKKYHKRLWQNTMGHSKNPKKAYTISVSKQPRSIIPESSNSYTPGWSFSLFSKDEEWCFSGDEFLQEILPTMKHFETMTWQEIISASGGRRKGTNSHPIPFSDLSKEAQKKLSERQMEYDEVFSLRLSGLKRIIGIREERILKILWYCEDHQACQSIKRNT